MRVEADVFFLIRAAIRAADRPFVSLLQIFLKYSTLFFSKIHVKCEFHVAVLTVFRQKLNNLLLAPVKRRANFK